jgi:transposase InsO family protein
MGQHLRGRLGPAGRIALVRLMREQGMSERQAAACLSVAPATAHHWSVRERQASDTERGTGGWALDRSSRPHTSPRRTPAELEARVCEERRRTGWGPRLIAPLVGLPHSTVHRVLRRHGRSRPELPAREPDNRYEWPCPGDLLHIDVARYARFERPGHAVTGDRSQRSRDWMKPETRVGYDFAHAIVDDATRLAYVELHADEKAQTVTGFVERALVWFESRGIVCRRLMSDNAFTYAHNRSLRELLATNHIRHLRTQPYRPRTNGKVERFHQTMAREWAYGLTYRSHRHRNAALSHWLHHYNERRPHSALGGQTPLSRTRNLLGQDN